MTNTQPTPTQYRVSIWEFMAITAGAIILISLGCVGLGVKFVRNAFQPKRAEAIVRNIMEYQIPDGAQGLFGVNIGSGKIGVLGSTDAQSEVQLLVGKFSIDSLNKTNDITEIVNNMFNDLDNVTASRTENKNFCGVSVPVKIDEGELTLPNQTLPISAVRYTAKATFEDSERLVILLINGPNAETKAAQIFNSLKCK